MSKSTSNFLVRIQSPEGIKRIEISPKSSFKQLYECVQRALKIDGFGLFKERTFSNELYANSSQQIGSALKHGDMIYLKQIAGSSARRPSTASIDNFENFSGSLADNFSKTNVVIEDEVDQLLAKEDGLIKRGRDTKLCHHASNGCCVHCSPMEPYDESYLKEHKIKHLSFHSYIRKQTSGIDRGKYMVFDDINCRIKTGCRDHLPWPKGICSKCQPSAITLNRQVYRHVDNVMFENTNIVERFLNYWRTTGHQRMGFLYGTYEMNTDVPLGIRATVAAIYEPPQETTRDSIKFLDDEAINDVEEVAKALGLRKVGWIFTDLITDDPAAGTVKQLRGIETHFLTAQECITAGDKIKQVHMEGYAVSAQCMALVRDNCLVPTKDAPELGYIRESSDKQYVPDVYYKVSNKYKLIKKIGENG
uniref:MPN domain-containing protein n=1 Tax=Glossina pallidipes TaxID=7398 RepID=A0A1A9ZAB3_GLOPL